MIKYGKRHLARLSFITDGDGKANNIVVSTCPAITVLCRKLMGVMARMINTLVVRTIE